MSAFRDMTKAIEELAQDARREDVDAIAFLRKAELVAEQAINLKVCHRVHQGDSWAEIGRSLSITRQAAQKKYLPIYRDWAAFTAVDPRV